MAATLATRVYPCGVSPSTCPESCASGPGGPLPRYARVATSAGVTSALDLTLSFVAEDHGPALARRVARSLVTYLQRPGTQAQMSLHVAAPAPADDVVRRVVDHVGEHLDTDLGAPVLAAQPGSASATSPACSAPTSAAQPPSTSGARTEAAAHLVATTDVPLARVASRCGFRSTETMRTAFHDAYGRTPSEHRRAFAVNASR